LSVDGENITFLLGFYGGTFMSCCSGIVGHTNLIVIVRVLLLSSAGKKDGCSEPTIDTLTYLESKGVDLTLIDKNGNNILCTSITLLIVIV
jgi:hypothetical protein